MTRNRKLPTGVYRRLNSPYLWIRYPDEFGKETRESTKQCDAEVAEKIRARRLAESAMRRHFPTRKFDEASFRELHDFWWKLHGRETKSGFEYLTPEILEWFGDMKARAITSETVKEYLDQKQLGGLSASSLNHRRTILNSIFNFAIRWKKFDENPVAAIPQFREPRGRRLMPTTRQIHKLLGEARKISDELWVFLLLLITTSARTMEILSRRWSEVYLDVDIPYIYVPETKSGREKILYLTEEDVDALKQLPSYVEENEYVFPSRPTARFPNPKKPHRWSFGKKFREAARNAGLRKKAGEPEENLRIHDLRHFSISIMTSRGVPEPVIRLISGHSSRELRRYQHLMGDIPKQTVHLIAEELRT